MKETDNLWITTQDLALIKGITSRAVRKAISDKKYIARKNGRQYEVLITSLEKEVQNKIQNQSLVDKNISATIEISEKTRVHTLEKFNLVIEWRKFRKNYNGTKAASVKDFIMAYSIQENKNFNPVFKNLGIATMFRWDKKLRDNNNDWKALIPNYMSSLKDTTSLSEKEQKIFLSLLLHPNKPNIGKAIKLTKHILKEQGFKNCSCDMTYRRFAEKYQKNNYNVWILAREGEKALKDKVLPYIERDVSQLEVGDVIIGDGHRLALQVINPFTGKPCRPMLVGYQDWKSGALLGFEIMLEENTQCIASALRNSIINLGKIPKFIYQDNGKAFKAKYFTDDNIVNGLFIRLGIQPIFAKPYNAKAKPIERFWREMQDSFEMLLPSFVGSGIENQPAYMKRNEKFHKEYHIEYIPTIQEVIELINKWMCFHYSQSCPNVENKTIGEVLESGKGNGIKLSLLDDLMMATEIKSIGRNGIRFLKSDYYDESLFGLRTTVVIKYSLFDLSQIKVFDTKGKFICIAKRMKAINPLANYIGSAKDIEELQQRTKQQKLLEKQTVKTYLSELKKNEIFISSIEEANYEEYKSTEEQKMIIEKMCEIDKVPKITFKNQYERFEYLCSKPELTQEEKLWIDNYKNSEEYYLIYNNDN